MDRPICELACEQLLNQKKKIKYGRIEQHISYMYPIISD